MRRKQVLLLVYGAYAGRCRADANEFDPLCNSKLKFANASGVVEYQPDFNQGAQVDQKNNTSGKTLPTSFATTLTEDRDSTSLWVTTWINTNGANYSDNAHLGYDVCQMTLTDLPTNTELRAQNDTGDCMQMLDDACVQAIRSAAETYAERLILNRHATALHNDSQLSQSCPEIAHMINADPPEECGPYFSANTTWYDAAALTDSQSSPIYHGCQAQADDDDDTTTAFKHGDDHHSSPWWSLNSAKNSYSNQIYDLVVTHVSPVLMIWVSVSNPSPSTSTTQPNTKPPSTATATSTALLKCLRPKTISPGSRVPAVLPAPEPVVPFSQDKNKQDGESSSSSDGSKSKSNDDDDDAAKKDKKKKSKKLTDACIAGIAIGAIVGVALVIGGGVIWWLRRKTRKMAAVAVAGAMRGKGEDDGDANGNEPPHAGGGGSGGGGHGDYGDGTKNLHELPQPYRVFELDAAGREPVELETKCTMELEGSTPNTAVEGGNEMMRMGMGGRRRTGSSEFHYGHEHQPHRHDGL